MRDKSLQTSDLLLLEKCFKSWTVACALETVLTAPEGPGVYA